MALAWLGRSVPGDALRGLHGMLEHRAVQLLADEPESIVDVRVPVRIEGGDPHEPRVVVEEHEPQFVNPDLCELLGHHPVRVRHELVARFAYQLLMARFDVEEGGQFADLAILPALSGFPRASVPVCMFGMVSSPR